jgi:hypothetical protein
LELVPTHLREFFMAKQSVLDRLAELNTEREGLLAQATQEAMDKANQAIAALNGLGHSHTYKLVEERAKGKTTGGTREAAACSVCGFKTNPPHTARRHAKQGDNTKPFTAAELNEQGLEKVA